MEGRGHWVGRDSRRMGSRITLLAGGQEAKKLQSSFDGPNSNDLFLLVGDMAMA